MRNTMLIVVVILSIFVNSEIYACEPCGKSLDFNETVRQADLIIVGKKVLDGPHTDPREERYGGPDWIETKVIKILKGQIEEERIKVNSWNGMCGYGIVIDDKDYVIFLEKRDGRQSAKDHQYDAVNYGCSIKKYSVENNMVVFGEEKISMKEFIRKLNESLKKE